MSLPAKHQSKIRQEEQPGATIIRSWTGKGGRRPKSPELSRQPKYTANQNLYTPTADQVWLYAQISNPVTAPARREFTAHVLRGPLISATAVCPKSMVEVRAHSHHANQALAAKGRKGKGKGEN